MRWVSCASMGSFQFSREKYLHIFQTQGASAALSTLQTDVVGWEVEAFEGVKGYQPEMWKELQKARDFARELWDRAIEESPTSGG